MLTGEHQPIILSYYTELNKIFIVLYLNFILLEPLTKLPLSTNVSVTILGAQVTPLTIG